MDSAIGTLVGLVNTFVAVRVIDPHSHQYNGMTHLLADICHCTHIPPLRMQARMDTHAGGSTKEWFTCLIVC
jgi:hypothetical protein